MPDARMFDDLGNLVEGDRFVVWVLGEALAYRVVSMETVLPTEVEKLQPEEGRDLVTLVTCVPYGANTHRLLVTGERCEYIPDEEEVPAVEVYVNRRTVPLAVGLVATLGTATAGGVAGFRRRARERRRRVGRSASRR
jgi:sortase A